MSSIQSNPSNHRPHPASAPIRLAFIGTGHWARRYHLPSLRHIRDERPDSVNLSLHGIYGPKTYEADELAKQYGFGRVYADLNELIADPDVDAVAIVITPKAVRGVVEHVLAKEVPILTEKPPGATCAEAEELAQLVRVTNVVAFNRRYNLLNNRFKELLAAQGPIEAVRGCMYRLKRREPHFVLHTGPHLINLMEYLFGPIRTLRNEKPRDPATGEPAYLAHIVFDSGTKGEIYFSPCSDRHWEGVTVQANGQTLTLHSPHNDTPGEITRHPRNQGAAEGADGEVLATSGAAPPIVEEGYALEYLDLFAAMSGRSSAGRDSGGTRSNFQNAVNTMRVAEAIETNVDIG